MRQQVSSAEYGRCVARGACKLADVPPVKADVPITGVSYLDATAYADWYSNETGYVWRLPTAERSSGNPAGERFSGDAFSAAADDPANPAVAWIGRYREEAAAKRPAEPQLQPRGFYGANTNGVERATIRT